MPSPAGTPSILPRATWPASKPCHTLLVLFPLLSVALPSVAAVPADKFPNLKTYPSDYYVIHTDLGADGVREAILRMNRMAEEYTARTRGFAAVGGGIHQRLPFYLFRHEDDYIAAGGVEGSWGLFNGEELMAVATDSPGPDTWHVVQHEGFHQFAKAVIGGELPMWVNEGLAEYFGEARFTGDGFATGLIPQDRLERVRDLIQTHAYAPFKSMLEMSRETWNSNLAMPNYDQAWSMIHFLAHAGNGRYQRPFADMMTQLSRGQDARYAFETTFHSADAFEAAWKKYWTTLPDNPTADAYLRADVATATSFLARATAARQNFTSFDDFNTLARDGKIKTDPDWLPPTLLVSALDDARDRGGRWTLDTPPGRAPQLAFIAAHGDKRFASSFTLQSGRVRSVAVTEPKPQASSQSSHPYNAAPRAR